MNLLQQKQENQGFLFNNAEILRFNKLKFQARRPPLRKKNYLKNDDKGNLVIVETVEKYCLDIQVKRLR